MFENFDWNQFLLYLLIGFFAQIIDGSLGMAYGVSANSFLLSAGVSPAVQQVPVSILPKSSQRWYLAFHIFGSRM